MKGGQHGFKQAQTTIQFLLGPIKIKDGLFMGDQLAAKDIEFIISNKVTHIINTVSKVVPNLYQRFGIQYLSVNWTEKQQNIFDKKNNAVNAIFSFVEEAMQAGESCLIHSVHGKSRACAVLVAYMMKKYSWSLSKCLEFINLKKEGLEIRNNYLVQMQQLEKRMMSEIKLSNSWNEIKNEEDLILANTYYNSKRSDNKPTNIPSKKQSTKRVAWNEKLVQKPTPSTQGAKTREQNPSSEGKLKPILKCEGEQQKLEYQSNINSFGEKQQKPADDRFISTINGNIVHVTVNNFINTEKKQPETPVKVYNTRPFSSDAKDRDKKNNTSQPNPNKLFPYDSGMANTFKNPYEMKVMGKIGANNKPAIKKKQEIRNPAMTYDRPTSANINNDKKKGTKMVGGNPLNEKLGYDMMIMGSTAKKRYPSTNPKEDSFKWK